MIGVGEDDDWSSEIMPILKERKKISNNSHSTSISNTSYSIWTRFWLQEKTIIINKCALIFLFLLLCKFITACLYNYPILNEMQTSLGCVNARLACHHRKAKNRTLVMIFGNLRGGERAWDSLFEHVLDVNCADLALFIGETDKDSSVRSRAKFIVMVPEYKNWLDALELVNPNKTWRPYLERGHITFRRSAIINLFLKWKARQFLIETDVLNEYDTFVITRADHFYGCCHDLSSLSPDKVWIPSGKDEENGLSDRHMVCDRKHITKCLSIIDPVLDHPEMYNLGPEQTLKQRFDEMGLETERFNRMMWLVREDSDSSRWSRGNARNTFKGKFVVKYDEEYLKATRTCLRSRWSTLKEIVKVTIQEQFYDPFRKQKRSLLMDELKTGKDSDCSVSEAICDE